MKKYLGLGCLLLALHASALPLSPAGRQEAEFFNTFLKAAYAQNQQDPQRFALLRKALEQDPTSTYIKQQLVAEALAVDAPELAEPYIDFIQEDPQDAESWATYGAYAWFKKDLPAALEAYEKALKLDPENELLLNQYITVLAASDPQHAAEELEELARMYPAGASVLYGEIGRMYLYYQDYPAALKALNKSLALNPDDTQVRLLRATVYEKTNQYFLMLHELEELEKMGYVTPQTLAQMGAVFVLVKDLPRAEEYFLKAKELENSNLAAGYFLSALAEQQGDYARAIAYLKDTADYATSPAKQIQVSYYQRKLNQEKESFKTISNAYKQFPQNNEVAYLYSVALYEQGKYGRSAQVLEKLVEKVPDSVDVRLQYAFALEGQKKYAQMEEQIKLILEKNPQHAPALNLLAYSLALRNTRLEEAAQLSARALAQWQDASFVDTQAWIFYLQGKYAQAADLLQSLSQDILKENPEMAYHLGMIYAAQNETEKARTYLQMAADGGWKDARKALKKLN